MEEELNRPVKLCGAARKRLRRLLAANVSFDEARELAVKPWSDIPITNLPPDPKPKKRRVSQELSEDQAKKTLGEKHVPQPSFKQEETQVGIKNQTPMSEEQMKLVHRALTLEMLDIDNKGKGPRFTEFIHKTGWILVTCQDQGSLKWLTGRIPYIKPWDGASLSVIPEDELPLPVGTTFIPSTEAESLDEAIRLLGIQNKGLNTEHWRVAHSRVEGNGQVVSFVLDDPSVVALRAMKFEVILGFKKLTFKISDDPDASPFSVAPEATSLPQPSTLRGSAREGREVSGSRLTVPGGRIHQVPRNRDRPVRPYQGISRDRIGSERQGDARHRMPDKPVHRSRGDLMSDDGNSWRTMAGRGHSRPNLMWSRKS